MYMHYQFCPVCGHSAMEDNVIMKACPCHEVFYCSKACQTDNWKEHKLSCTHYLRKRQGTLSQKLPMEDEVFFLLKHHDADLVEMAVAAMGPDVDLSVETERLAATFHIAARLRDGSKSPDPIGGWRADFVQPFHIEKVELGPVKDLAQQFGLGRDFLEHPIQRQKRLSHHDDAMLNINIVFEPTRKFVTKIVPRVQLSLWKMTQERERKTTNPPRLHYLRHVTNGRIYYMLSHEHAKRPPNASELVKQETDGVISTVGPKLEEQRLISLSASPNDPAPTVMKPCTVCGTLSATRCSLCHEVYYCSSEHIQSDWPSHKIDCYVRPPKDARPEIHTAEISGILFPVDEMLPRVIKIKCLTGYTLGWKTWLTLNLKPYIPDDEKNGRGHVVVDGAQVPSEGGVILGSASQIFFRKNFLRDGSKLNRCIQNITFGQMAVPWAGPFIAFRHAQVIGAIPAVMVEDMPALIQYFRTGDIGPTTAWQEAQKQMRKEARKEARRGWES